ncbi:MAG TPA: ATP-binding protein [Acidimicrobiales bacterium]
MSAPTPSVSPELKVLMRRLKLGQLITTLPERLALARSHELSHTEFLEQLFSDEVQRRDAASAGLRARAAKLDPHMVLEAWDEGAKIHLRPRHWVRAGVIALRRASPQRLHLGPGRGGKFLLGHCTRAHRVPQAHQRALRTK